MSGGAEVGQEGMRGAAFATFLCLAFLAVGNGAWVAVFQDDWPMAAIAADSIVLFTIGFVVLTIAHEAIHGITFGLLNRGQPGFKVEFGIDRRALMPYVHPSGLMPATTYRIGALAPGLLLGILPAIYALVTKDVYVAGWAILMIAGAAGDFMLLVQLRGVPGSVPVEDSEDSIGVRVRWDLVPSTKPDEGESC